MVRHGEAGGGARRLGRGTAVVVAAALAASGLVVSGPPIGAAVAGDNGKIVWSAQVMDAPPGTGAIWVANADGTGAVAITSGEHHDVNPAVSPNGEQIVFSSNRGEGGDYDLWLMGIDGADATQLTFGAGDEGWPTWSPDGSEIAYANDEARDFAAQTIEVLDVETGVVTTLTTGANDWHPSWSPDGATIAFVRQVDEGTDIYAAPATGGGPSTLLVDGGFDDFGPSWSPDGDHIVYTAVADAEYGDVNVWLAPVGDTAGTPQQLTDLVGWEYEPTFSPDGTRIAFVHDADIWTMDVDGSDPTPFFTGGTADDYPDWQAAPAAPPAPTTAVMTVVDGNGGRFATGDEIDVTVVDGDQDTTAGLDTVTVHAGDVDVVLAETGPATGTFNGRFTVPLGAPGRPFQITYVDSDADGEPALLTERFRVDAWVACTEELGTNAEGCILPLELVGDGDLQDGTELVVVGDEAGTFARVDILHHGDPDLVAGGYAPDDTFLVQLDTGSLRPDVITVGAVASGGGDVTLASDGEVRLELSPLPMSTLDACTPTGCGDDTSEASTDQAGVVGLTIEALDELDETRREALTPTGITTNANAVTFPVVDWAAGTLTMTLQAPALRNDGNPNPGFFAAFLPNEMLTTLLGFTSRAEVDAETLRVERVDGAELGPIDVAIQDGPNDSIVVAVQGFAYPDATFRFRRIDPSSFASVDLVGPPLDVVGAGGTPVTFDASITNNTDGDLGPLRLLATFTGPDGLGAGDLVVQHQASGAEATTPVPLTEETDGTLTATLPGEYTLEAGGELAADLLVQATLDAPTGELVIDLALQRDTGDGDWEPLTGRGLTTAIGRPTLTFDFPSRLAANGERRALLGTTTNPTGSDYEDASVVFSVTGAGLEAGDIVLEAQAGESWMPIPLAETDTGLGGTLSAEGSTLVAGMGDEAPFRIRAASGAPLGELQVTVAIVDLDDGLVFASTTDTVEVAPLALSLADVTLHEGDDGTTGATFTVTLDEAVFDSLEVPVLSEDGTATASTAEVDGDYEPLDTRVTIPAGASTAQVIVEVNGDTDEEEDETVALYVGDANATLTIVDDDTITPPPGGGGGGGGGTPPPAGGPRRTTDTVPPGGSISTGGAPTPDEPVQVTLTAPPGGQVTIEQHEADEVPEGFEVAGERLVIEAPAATAEDPLVLDFRVDRTALASGAPVGVFRNGALVPVCAAGDPATSGDAGTASPDPCVDLVEVDGDVVRVVVLTSRASTWEMGQPEPGSIRAACPAGTPDPAFRDADGSVHAAAIGCVAAHGVALGRSASSYHPTGHVTRGQMASFIARLLVRAGVELPSGQGGPFVDVPGHTHAAAINQLHALGVVTGRTAATYGPDELVTRAQMASFLVRAYDEVGAVALPEGGDAFVDDDGLLHEANIDAASAAGFALGTSDTTFDPGAPVTRGQMASFLARVLSWLALQRPMAP